MFIFILLEYVTQTVCKSGDLALTQDLPCVSDFVLISDVQLVSFSVWVSQNGPRLITSWCSIVTYLLSL